MCVKYRNTSYVNIDKTQIGRETPLWCPFSCTRSSASPSSRSSSVESGHLQARPAGPQLSALEIVFCVVGIASLPLCWYFNIRYVHEYATTRSASATGRSSSRWDMPIRVQFAGADYTIVNVILLPLFTIIDGRRRGIRRPWLFFVSSLFTSFVFALAFYLATVERQRRHQLAIAEVKSPV